MDFVDLNSLTEGERDIILKVIQRNDDLVKDEKYKARSIEKDIKDIRRKGMLKPGQDAGKSCARCRCEFGFFFGPRGQPCPHCSQLVCIQCRLSRPETKESDASLYGTAPWLCELCFKQKQLKAINGEWFFTRKATRKASDVIKSSIRRPRVESNNNEERINGEISDTQSQSSRNTETSGSSFRKSLKSDDLYCPTDNDRELLANLINDSTNKTRKPPKPSRTIKQISIRRVVDSSDSETDFSSIDPVKNESLEVIVTDTAASSSNDHQSSPTSPRSCHSIESITPIKLEEMEHPLFAKDRQCDIDSLHSLHNKTMSTCSTESIDTAFKIHTTTGTMVNLNTNTSTLTSAGVITTTSTSKTTTLSTLPHPTLSRTLSSKTTNLLSPFSVSTESMLSVYSMGAEGNNYCKFPITGDVYLSMNYDYRKETFEVEIKKCRDLAIADPKKKKVPTASLR